MEHISGQRSLSTLERARPRISPFDPPPPFVLPGSSEAWVAPGPAPLPTIYATVTQMLATHSAMLKILPRLNELGQRLGASPTLPSRAQGDTDDSTLKNQLASFATEFAISVDELKKIVEACHAVLGSDKAEAC